MKWLGNTVAALFTHGGTLIEPQIATDRLQKELNSTWERIRRCGCLQHSLHRIEQDQARWQGLLTSRTVSLSMIQPSYRITTKILRELISSVQACDFRETVSDSDALCPRKQAFPRHKLQLLRATRIFCISHGFSAGWCN